MLSSSCNLRRYIRREEASGSKLAVAIMGYTYEATATQLRTGEIIDIRYTKAITRYIRYRRVIMQLAVSPFHNLPGGHTYQGLRYRLHVQIHTIDIL